MKKMLILVLAVVLLSVVLGTWAFAATPQDIYDDYADNGVLDGTYTDAELQAYLNDATLHQYPPDATKVRELDALVRGMLADRDEYPYTGMGVEIALMAVGAVVLLGAGLGLRRMGRAKS